MRKTLIVLLSFCLVLAGCSSTETTNKVDNKPTQNVEDAINVVIPEVTATPNITAEPTPEPTPEIPDKPKYIFIVIGDGMGQGTASLGEIYTRIEAEDMGVGAVWESFDQKKIVGAMLDSSSGGTALSTGVKSKQGYIALNLKQQPLYTILDRAKEAGMDTGVITNSSLADATPATFITHTLSRYSYGEIISEIAKSNVDYLAGGGLRYFGNKYQAAELPVEDCYGIETYYKGTETLISELRELNYSLYYGKPGARVMLDRIANKDYPHEKSVYAMSLVYMPWEIEKYKAKYAGNFESVPNLCEMTELGMETLSQNPNGFVMMVEEAFIDKAAHMESQLRGIYQVKLLNDTLKTIMAFYEKHPNETLVVLTADHETGSYLYNEELFNEFKQLPNFKWSDDGDKVSEFLQNEWNFKDFESYYYNQIKNAQSDVWENEVDARTQAIAAITETTSRKYGTIITTNAHSAQDVPLYATGNGSEIFADCEHISQVPIFICDIMGWRALPEVLPEANE